MLHNLRTAPFSLPVLFSAYLWLSVAEGMGISGSLVQAAGGTCHVLHEALKVPSEITK